ncbi:regulator of G protein signaling superfamily, partial [Piedraia hortae CBS 480.64]
PQRPNLSQILANTSPAPWTLAAFIAYLASNHCLETLEFTMDARRYRSHYSSMMERATDGQLPPNQDRDLVQSLWTRLIRAYIRPNGTREVNLSSDVRDPILCVHEQMGEMPPDPDHLKPAVDQMYDLMESSVLVPFLNSLSP